MIILALIGLAIATVPLLGGRLRRLGDVQVHALGLIAAALALQILVFEVFHNAPSQVHAPIHLISYAMAGAFFWANRRLRGLWLVGIGYFANFLVIAANAGTMPASPTALRAAGLSLDPSAYLNSAPVASPRLAFLGDVFAIPAGWPLANVFSVGDVFIVFGMAYVLHHVGQSRLVRRAAPVAPVAPFDPDFALFGLVVE